MKASTLAKRALKNGPKPKPAPGMKYLKDVPVGSMFETATGMRGVLIEINANAKVVILNVNVSDEDKQYYTGKQIISADTEVLK
tara:strand:+ start:711 stop:962 length:252 start_codon:yes stop_codon:yes gene_type:complete